MDVTLFAIKMDTTVQLVITHHLNELETQRKQKWQKVFITDKTKEIIFLIIAFLMAEAAESCCLASSNY